MTEILTMNNGLRIVLEPIENAKTCSLGVWIASGSSYETPETAGTSHFIEHMLFRGTKPAPLSTLRLKWTKSEES